MLLHVFPFRAAKREHPGTCPFPITCTRNRHYHCRDTSPSFGNEPTDPLPFPPPLPRAARSGAVSRGVTAFQRGASRGGRGDERDEQLYPGRSSSPLPGERTVCSRAPSVQSRAESQALTANLRHLVSRHFPSLTGLASRRRAYVLNSKPKLLVLSFPRYLQLRFQESAAAIDAPYP